CSAAGGRGARPGPWGACAGRAVGRRTGGAGLPVLDADPSRPRPDGGPVPVDRLAGRGRDPPGDTGQRVQSATAGALRSDRCGARPDPCGAPALADGR
ncbi:hypothetical protein CN938_31165, partial [Bacillus thuringiensis]